MSEAISLFVTFVIVAIVYEYMKPKENYEASNHHKEDDDEEEKN